MPIGSHIEFMVARTLRFVKAPVLTSTLTVYESCDVLTVVYVGVDRENKFIIVKEVDRSVVLEAVTL